MVAQITYNTQCERLQIQSEEVHCGCVLRVLLPEGWKEVRIEYGETDQGYKGWYIVGYDYINPLGLWVEI